VQREVHRDGEADEHKAEAYREGKVALGGLQRNGRCHHAGDVVDIATHNHDCADFADTTAKASQRSREQGAAAIPEKCFDTLAAGCVEREQQVVIFGPEIANRLKTKQTELKNTKAAIARVEKLGRLAYEC